jgi:hypothetical protein
LEAPLAVSDDLQLQPEQAFSIKINANKKANTVSAFHTMSFKRLPRRVLTTS